MLEMSDENVSDALHLETFPLQNASKGRFIAGDVHNQKALKILLFEKNV